MHLVLNLLIALIAGFLTDFVLGRAGVPDPLKVVIAVLVALLVFFADLASQLN